MRTPKTSPVREVARVCARTRGVPCCGEPGGVSFFLRTDEPPSIPDRVHLSTWRGLFGTDELNEMRVRCGTALGAKGTARDEDGRP